MGQDPSKPNPQPEGNPNTRPNNVISSKSQMEEILGKGPMTPPSMSVDSNSTNHHNASPNPQLPSQLDNQSPRSQYTMNYPLGSLGSLPSNVTPPPSMGYDINPSVYGQQQALNFGNPALSTQFPYPQQQQQQQYNNPGHPGHAQAFANAAQIHATQNGPFLQNLTRQMGPLTQIGLTGVGVGSLNNVGNIQNNIANVNNMGNISNVGNIQNVPSVNSVNSVNSINTINNNNNNNIGNLGGMQINSIQNNQMAQQPQQAVATNAQTAEATRHYINQMQVLTNLANTPNVTHRQYQEQVDRTNMALRHVQQLQLSQQQGVVAQQQQQNMRQNVQQNNNMRQNQAGMNQYYPQNTQAMDTRSVGSNASNSATPNMTPNTTPPPTDAHIRAQQQQQQQQLNMMNINNMNNLNNNNSLNGLNQLNQRNQMNMQYNQNNNQQQPQQQQNQSRRAVMQSQLDAQGSVTNHSSRDQIGPHQSHGSRSHRQNRIEEDVSRLYPVLFTWTHGGRDVYVAYSGDGWGQKYRLKPTTLDSSNRPDRNYNHHHAAEGDENVIFLLRMDVRVGKHHYKYIVDNQWRCAQDQKYIQDVNGAYSNVLEVNLNNINTQTGLIHTSPLQINLGMFENNNNINNNNNNNNINNSSTNVLINNANNSINSINGMVENMNINHRQNNSTSSGMIDQISNNNNNNNANNSRHRHLTVNVSRGGHNNHHNNNKNANDLNAINLQHLLKNSNEIARISTPSHLSISSDNERNLEKTLNSYVGETTLIKAFLKEKNRNEQNAQNSQQQNNNQNNQNSQNLMEQDDSLVPPKTDGKDGLPSSDVKDINVGGDNKNKNKNDNTPITAASPTSTISNAAMSGMSGTAISTTASGVLTNVRSISHRATAGEPLAGLMSPSMSLSEDERVRNIDETLFTNEKAKDDMFSQDPPTVPPQLHYAAVLNSRTKKGHHPLILPTPLRVTLNHLYMSDQREEDIVTLGVTERFREKFYTTVFYKPISSGGNDHLDPFEVRPAHF